MEFWITGTVLTAFALAALLVPIYRHRESTLTAISITVLMISLPMAVVLIYRLVGNYPAAMDPRVSSDIAVTDPQNILAIREMVASLAARLNESPDDLEGWMMLGRSYVSLEQFAEAREAYQRAYLMTGGQSLTATLGYAEAMVLADSSTLSGEAGVLIETTLKMAPQDPKALWYGGLSAVERGEMQLAAERWNRLLNLDLPEMARKVVQQQLVSLGGSIAAKPSDSVDAGLPFAIEVEITVTEDLRERVEGSTPLFVVARDPDQPGPPIAVVRQVAENLPMTVSITDANLMLPGRSLVNLPRLKLIARVARGGDPIAQPGDIYGETLWDASTHGNIPVAIVIDSVFE